MGKWSEEAGKFSGKIYLVNRILDEGISGVQEIYKELDFDPTNEDSLAFNTNLFVTDVERLITEKKEGNEELAGNVINKADLLDQEEELAKQKASEENDTPTTETPEEPKG